MNSKNIGSRALGEGFGPGNNTEEIMSPFLKPTDRLSLN